MSAKAKITPTCSPLLMYGAKITPVKDDFSARAFEQ